MFAPKDTAEGIIEGNRIPKSSRRLSLSLRGKKVSDDALDLPCQHLKRKRTEAATSVAKDKSTLVGSVGDGKSFLCTKTQTVSSLTVEDGAGKEIITQMKQGENTLEEEAVIGGLH